MCEQFSTFKIFNHMVHKIIEIWYLHIFVNFSYFGINVEYFINLVISIQRSHFCAHTRVQRRLVSNNIQQASIALCTYLF